MFPSHHRHPASTGTPPADRFRVTTTPLPDRTVVLRLSGEATVDQRKPLRDALRTAVGDDPALLVIDLSALGFCDATLLNALLETRLIAGTAEVPLVLAGPPAQARRLLRLTGTDALLDLRPSLDAALPTGGAGPDR